MDQKVLEHVKNYWVKEGYAKEIADVSDSDVVEIIREGNTVWVGDEDSRRWWTNITTVVKIDGMFIMFAGASTTGDDSPTDKGWKFDPSTIKECEEFEETVTIKKYRAKN